MPRKSSPRAAATPKTPTASEETPSRRGNRKAAATKQPAKEAGTPASEPKRSRRSSTAAQTAASQADSRKTRSRTSTSDSPDRKSSRDESADRGSPTPRATRRPMKKVNYEESEGEEDTSAVKPELPEEDYDAEDDIANDSDSLESTSKKKGKLKASPPPPKPKAAKTRARSGRSSRSSRSSRKKKESDEDEAEQGGEEEDEEEEGDEQAAGGDTTDGPAAPDRKGRHTAEKSEPPKEEKPKGGTRSRRTAAAPPATPPVATTPARPSRAAKQKKAPAAAAVEAETAKPVRASSRRSRSKVEEPQEDEEMEKDEVEKEETEKQETEEGESKKRKLEDDEEGEEKRERKKSKKEKDNSAVTEEPKTTASEETKKEEKKEEAEEESEEPMEVDAEDQNDAGNKEKKDETPVTEEKSGKAEEPAQEEDAGEEEGDEEEADEEEKVVGEKAPTVAAGDAKEQTEKVEEEEEEEEDEEEEQEEEEEVTKTPAAGEAPKEAEPIAAEHTSPSTNQNEVAKPDDATQGDKKESMTNAISSGVPPPAEPLSNAEPAKADAFQNTLAKSSHESVNGTPPTEDRVVRNETPATQMLPSSAVELNQQHSTPNKTEADVVCVSANGHVSDEKQNTEGSTNDRTQALFHGRLYQNNPSPCAVALSNIRERTFGLVSLNLESTKVDEKLLLDLKMLNCDIICMQGLLSEQFSKHLEPSLDALGYKGAFAQDEGRGVATFYRTSSFSLKIQKNLLLKQSIRKDLEHSLSQGEGLVVAENLPPCGQVLFTHLGLLQSSRAVAVANVLVPPSDVSTQALQMSCLAREAVGFLENSSSGSGVPLVLCGGFNIQQKEAAYQLLRDGYLSNEMIETLQNKKELKLPEREEDTSLLNLLWKSFQHSTSGLKSCYSAVTGQEMEFGNPGCASTSPDLIWFSSDSLTPIGVLQAPSTPTLGHRLPLKADLAFNY